jgi:hypothetical protein
MTPIKKNRQNRGREAKGEKQIPFGDDKQEGKGKTTADPYGMTTQKAKASSTADTLRR